MNDLTKDELKAELDSSSYNIKLLESQIQDLNKKRTDAIEAAFFYLELLIAVKENKITIDQALVKAKSITDDVVWEEVYSAIAPNIDKEIAKLENQISNNDMCLEDDTDTMVIIEETPEDILDCSGI